MDYTIKDLREKNGFSTSELATRLEVSEDEVKGWESGKVIPSDSQRSQLANLFSVTPHEISFGTTPQRT